MVLTLASTQAAAEYEQPIAGPGRLHRYSMFGRNVQSDIPLPLAETALPIGRAPDWRFRRMPDSYRPSSKDGSIVSAIPCVHGRIVTLLREGTSGTWLWNLGMATCHIAPGSETVDVYPESGCSDTDLGYLLLGQVSALLLQKRGLPALHASAVATEGGAIVFLGPKGRGKSTMAGFVVRQGGAVLTDDLLPLQRDSDGAVVGLSSFPLMKAWPSTIECVLGFDERFPNVAGGLDKKAIDLNGRLPFQQGSERIHTIFVLSREEAPDPANEGCAAVPLRGRDTVAALLQHTEYRAFLSPAQLAALLPLYSQLASQARILLLRYPSGLERLSEVYARIHAEVTAQ